MGTNAGTREREMAGERLLSEAQCKAARASSRLFYLNDGGGLRLRVRPNGSRHWIYRYRFGDLEKSTSLGPYPEVSLKAARQRLQAMRTVVRDGLSSDSRARSEDFSLVSLIGATALL